MLSLNRNQLFTALTEILTQANDYENGKLNTVTFWAMGYNISIITLKTNIRIFCIVTTFDLRSHKVWKFKLMKNGNVGDVVSLIIKIFDKRYGSIRNDNHLVSTDNNETNFSEHILCPTEDMFIRNFDNTTIYRLIQSKFRHLEISINFLQKEDRMIVMSSHVLPNIIQLSFVIILPENIPCKTHLIKRKQTENEFLKSIGFLKDIIYDTKFSRKFIELNSLVTQLFNERTTVEKTFGESKLILKLDSNLLITLEIIHIEQLITIPLNSIVTNNPDKKSIKVAYNLIRKCLDYYGIDVSDKK